MLAIPLDVLDLLDARLFHRTPKFDRPRKDTHVLIGPLIEGAGDDLLGMVLEIVKDGNVRISCDLRSLLANLLKCPQIIGGMFIIRAVTDSRAIKLRSSCGRKSRP